MRAGPPKKDIRKVFLFFVSIQTLKCNATRKQRVPSSRCKLDYLSYSLGISGPGNLQSQVAGLCGEVTAEHAPCDAGPAPCEAALGAALSSHLGLFNS